MKKLLVTLLVSNVITALPLTVYNNTKSSYIINCGAQAYHLAPEQATLLTTTSKHPLILFQENKNSYTLSAVLEIVYDSVQPMTLALQDLYHTGFALVYSNIFKKIDPQEYLAQAVRPTMTDATELTPQQKKHEARKQKQGQEIPTSQEAPTINPAIKKALITQIALALAQQNQPNQASAQGHQKVTKRRGNNYR